MKKISLVLSLFFLLPFGIFAQNTEDTTDTEDEQLHALQFRNIGPTRGGRATAVAGITSDPATYYMGSTGGGLWKTKDYGHSWQNVSDGYFNTPSIGAVRVYQPNSEIVYVGTGSDGIRSNIITGKGMYKSVNGGKSWTSIGLEKTGHIGAVEIHPSDSNTVFVAAIGQAFQPNPERGIYRTKDGGKSWKKILFIADTIGVADLELAPDNPNIIYAAAWRVERKPWTIISGGMEGGIYKSVDGGDNWTKLSNGLPDGVIGKIDLAVSADDPNRLYALIEAPVGKGGLYRSDNRGENFELVSTQKDLLDRPFYYCNVDANPMNADVVYVNSTRFFRSQNGGKTWKRLPTPHGDNHDMWINPKDSSIFVQANDGGVNITLNGGKSWSTQHNQSTAELYQVEVDDQFPYWVYAGQQDNSTITLPSQPPFGAVAGGESYWMAVGGCETGPVVPKPGNPSIVYANCKGRFGVYDKTTGQEQQYYVGASNMYGHNPKELAFRFQRVSPIHVSPHDPNVVYHTSQYVHKTADDGKTWDVISPDLTAFTPETQVISGAPITRDITGEEFYSTIYSIRESVLEKGLIWVGANDGPVHVTLNGGRSWKKVTPGDLPPGGRVDAVEPSPHQANKAFVAVLRYQLGDWKPYLYKTQDYGKTWKKITNGIPDDYPTRVIREDPDREGLLYAGTEFGLFISFDDGENWQAFQQNLPVTPITDIKVHRKDLVLSTMGRGFWIMDNLSPLHQKSEQILTMEEPHLFKPENTYRMRYRPSAKGSIPQYPGPGLLIDYYLPEQVQSGISIEIFNQNKQKVRSYSSIHNTKPDEEDREISMSTGFSTDGSSPAISAKKGLHRIQWDLRYDGPWHSNPKRNGRGGPMVAPGQYSVKLRIGDQIEEQLFEVYIDPRVKAAGTTTADLLKQEELALKIRALQDQSRRMAAKVKEQKSAVSKLLNDDKKGEAARKKYEELDKLERELVMAEGHYQKPVLVDQINYLGSMLDRADQLPGKDAYQRYEVLKSWLERLTPDFEKIEDGVD